MLKINYLQWFEQCFGSQNANFTVKLYHDCLQRAMSVPFAIILPTHMLSFSVPLRELSKCRWDFSMPFLLEADDSITLGIFAILCTAVYGFDNFESNNYIK